MKGKVCVLIAVFLITACGGGGGDNSPASPAAPVVVAQLTCPDGSKVPLSSGASACPAVTVLAGSAAYTNVDPRSLTSGIVVQYNGALDPTSASTGGNVILTHGTATVHGVVSLSSDDMDLFYVPTQWLAYGQTYSLAVNVDDSVGRDAQVIVPITTIAMSCTDTKVWSTPATYTAAYANCVAPLGVQAKLSQSYNLLQDDTCTITDGVALTPECKAYFANGTMLLANTTKVIGGHATIWMAFVGTDKSNHLVLLDVNDTGNPIPVDTLALPSPLTSITGNPTGAFIRTLDTKGSQITVGADNKLVATCLLNCQ